MRWALFSDIHANLEALERAIEGVRQREIEKIVVLGDTVGYGADPNDCLQWVLDHAAVVLTGNHERAVVDPNLRNWFNPEARTAIEWTERVLSPKLKKAIPDLKYQRMEPGAVFAHGSLHEPEAFHYLMSFASAEPSFKLLEAPVCFVGHTHVPSCFCLEDKSAETLVPGVRVMERGKKYICNPGSVGQPRDGDWRLAFGVYDDAAMTFEIVRLQYDNERAAEKIRKAGLPRFLAERLL